MKKHILLFISISLFISCVRVKDTTYEKHLVFPSDASQEKKIEIEVLLNKDEFTRLMKLIDEEKIDAFVTAGNVSEVYGLWMSKKSKQRRKI